jgi:cytochrome c-type biogenesis protein CcmF
LIHSLAVTEKRGAFKAWTVLLAICAFSLSLMGTFLVRSGVLTSVHAFATDPRRGVFILLFLTIVIGSSLALYSWRAPRVGLGGRFSTISRESMLLGNNILLAVAAAAVLLGTLYPLFLDALGGGKISVGPPYFDLVFSVLMSILVFLMGIGPIARWKDAPLPDLWTRLRWALAVAIVVAVVLPFVGGHWSPVSALGYGLAAWIVVTTIVMARHQVRNAAGSWSSALRQQPKAWWGMVVAHLGVAVFIVGVTTVKTFEIERDVKMSPGDTLTLRNYVFRYDGVAEVKGPNYTAARGTVAVTRNGSPMTTLYPEKRLYVTQPGNPMTEAAIDTGVTGDIYVSLGEAVDDNGGWTVRVYYKPFVTWIWGGCVLMAIGGLLAVFDRRYRTQARRDATTIVTQAA